MPPAAGRRAWSLLLAVASLLCASSEGLRGTALEHSCRGTSPTGVRWQFAQPQHTATTVIVKALKTLPNVTHCTHGHYAVEKDEVAPRFIFMFVAPPRHRVISSLVFRAVLNRAIDGRNVAGDQELLEALKSVTSKATDFSKVRHLYHQFACGPHPGVHLTRW